MPNITITPELQSFLIFLPFLFLSLAAHEYAHALAAFKLGDETAYRLGRLTLNPIKHLDPIGSVALPLLSFASGFALIGWAKPVPVTTINLRVPRRDDIIVSAAGPVMNLLIAFLFAGSLSLLTSTGAIQSVPDAVLNAMIQHGVGFNIMLFCFNLLPFPPLDGSHILYAVYPNRITAILKTAGWVGLLALMFFIYSPLWKYFLYLVRGLAHAVFTIVGL